VNKVGIKQKITMPSKHLKVSLKSSIYHPTTESLNTKKL